MKEQIMNFLKSKNAWFWLATALFVALLAFVLHDCAYALAAIIPVTSGRIISGTPLTTEITRGHSKDLLMNEIDKRITKVRPMVDPYRPTLPLCRRPQIGLDGCRLLLGRCKAHEGHALRDLYRACFGQRHHRRTEGADYHQQQRHLRGVRDHSRARCEGV